MTPNIASWRARSSGTLWQVWNLQTNAVSVSLGLFDELLSPDQNLTVKGCDNHINQGRKPIDQMHCMLACPGNSLELCGGHNAIVIYSATKPPGYV